jgi:hypothetical protein
VPTVMRHVGSLRKYTCGIRVSINNISQEIVRELDKDIYAPPGFLLLKPYGFKWSSLPTTVDRFIRSVADALCALQFVRSTSAPMANGRK